MQSSCTNNLTTSAVHNRAHAFGRVKRLWCIALIGAIGCARGDTGSDFVDDDDDSGVSGSGAAGQGGAVGQGGAGGDDCSMASQQCVGPDVYWFDCDGNQTSQVAQSCSASEFCIGNGCIEPDYSDNWIITASPNTKTFACGSATYSPSQVTISVDATTMTVMTTNFTPQITYTGQLNGKAAVLNGSYLDSGGGTHTIVQNWVFDSPNSFSGTESDHIVVGSLDCGTLVWNLTGNRQ